MAEHTESTGSTVESVVDKVSEKIHDHDSSSSSSSDSDTETPASPSSVKAKIYRLFGREKPVHSVFGGGKPADVLLWRNKKISAGVLGGATAIWVFFELLEYHLLTLVCHILIVALAILFLWSNAHTFINKVHLEHCEELLEFMKELQAESVRCNVRPLTLDLICHKTEAQNSPTQCISGAKSGFKSGA